MFLGSLANPALVSCYTTDIFINKILAVGKVEIYPDKCQPCFLSLHSFVREMSLIS